MYIKIKVTPNAKKEKFERKQEDFFEIAVKEKAKQNMANERAREIIARHFGIIKGKVRIISGHRSPSKIISVDNI
ncbi:hypothetical protein COT82_01900 [Candidatus Campbellbacteria bacterium CG10_big_fil_rev_8_21_14_0_10_35_52]|uniref:Uncharacterized protein n=1 Tax=Candidatus Campbellbacteria bacterium CG10_big_fil_rev_8_21_14_0_10_35_52 TaxID=1974527 RepID=A0A2M6WV31_9BACT|nr:MAG: hypothetical protein COT82_01900 [Candidatus Campbellbacteria bacterium CG10_big_fil_rev_8_21_14_0_10_35_52]